jgi:glutathione S-transferase
MRPHARLPRRRREQSQDRYRGHVFREKKRRGTGWWVQLSARPSFCPQTKKLVRAVSKRVNLPRNTAHGFRCRWSLLPAVIDDGVVLRESNTIVRYLATKYGSDEIYPRNPEDRGGVEQWMDWANYETSNRCVARSLAMLNEPAWSHPWFIEVGRRQITKEVGQLDEHLARQGPYIVGNNFTVADIPIGLVINRWFCLNFERPTYLAVVAYYDLLGERSPYRRHVRNGLP